MLYLKCYWLCLLKKELVFSVSFLWTLKMLQACIRDNSNLHMYNHINNLFFSSEWITGYKSYISTFSLLSEIGFWFFWLHDNWIRSLVLSEMFPLLFHLFIVVCIAANALKLNADEKSWILTVGWEEQACWLKMPF